MLFIFDQLGKEKSSFPNALTFRHSAKKRKHASSHPTHRIICSRARCITGHPSVPALAISTSALPDPPFPLAAAAVSERRSDKSRVVWNKFSSRPRLKASWVKAFDLPREHFIDVTGSSAFILPAPVAPARALRARLQPQRARADSSPIRPHAAPSRVPSGPIMRA